MLGITVTGTGEVTGTPDTVELDLGVSVLGSTVREAASRATERATALMSALADGAIDRRDITTADYSINPEYDYSSNQQRLIGYRVNNTCSGQGPRPRGNRLDHRLCCRGGR